MIRFFTNSVFLPMICFGIVNSGFSDLKAAESKEKSAKEESKKEDPKTDAEAEKKKVKKDSGESSVKAKSPSREESESVPPSGQKPPAGVVYESKDGWDFKKDALAFYNDCPNKNKARYFVWKDYYWKVTDKTITVYDPRTYGTSLTVFRNQVDKKNRPLKDKDVMNDIKDQAKDLRVAAMPEDYRNEYYHGHRHFNRAKWRVCWW